MNFGRIAFALALLWLVQAASAAPFTPGNVVIYRVGDGIGPLANTGNPVFLDEYSPTGTLVQSIPMPTTPSGVNARLVASGIAVAEGGLSRSTNGLYLVATGYDAQTPYQSPLSGTPASSVGRAIGRVDYAGSVDTSTVLTDLPSGCTLYGAVSDDGSRFWLTGSRGDIRFAPFAAITSTQIAGGIPGLKNLAISDGQLHVSRSQPASGILRVGSGLPTTAGQPLTPLALLPAGLGRPCAFFFADLSEDAEQRPDTLYVADESIGLRKYSLTEGLWDLSGTVGSGADDYRGLTATIVENVVTLYATRRAFGGAGGGELVKIIDSSGNNGILSGVPSVIATAVPNTVFRGIALTPEALPDLSVEVSAPATNTLGTPFDYTITVRNTGELAASGITVSFKLPSDLAVGAGPDADGFTGPGATEGQEVVEFTNGTLAAGATATLVLTVWAVSDGTYTTDPQVAVVDPDEWIREGNENNNATSAAVTTVVSAAGPEPTTFTWIAPVGGNWSDATKWTNDKGDGSAPESGGAASYELNFNTAGSYGSFNNQATGFALNRLNLGGSEVRLMGQSIEFTDDGVTSPQIRLNSGSEVTIEALVGSTSDLTFTGTGDGTVTLAGGLYGDGGLIKHGPGILALTAANTYAGQTTIYSGTLALTSSLGIKQLVSEGSFEKPPFGAEGWSYNTNFTGWTITGTAGIASSYTPWVEQTPDGGQVAFLQGVSSISQNVSVATSGDYLLTFRTANRPGYPANGLIFKIDGVQADSWNEATIESDGYFHEQSATVRLSAGSHVIEFIGWNAAGGDVATAIDDVSLVGPIGKLPEGTQVNLVTAGAILDIGETEQTIADLAGIAGTTVINHGSLTVNTQISSDFEGTLSGGGRIIKDGPGILSLSGVNNCSGDVRINEGTLKFTSPNLNNETSNVFIDYGATLELNFEGVEIVGSFDIGESSMEPGIYTASNSFGTITGTGWLQVIAPPAAPEIHVENEGQDLAGGAQVDFGIVVDEVPSDAVRVLVVRNSGNADLDIDVAGSLLSGMAASDFSISLAGFEGVYPDIARLSPGGHGYLVISFSPSAPGLRTATISLPSNDADEAIYTIQLSGGSPKAPVFVTQPAGLAIDPNTALVLNSQASGVPVPIYQWYQGDSGDDSNPISGATLPSFTTPALTADTHYWVRATNPSGTADSNTAVVTIKRPSLAEIGVSVGTPLGFLPLNSGDTLNFGNWTMTTTPYTSIKSMLVGNFGSDSLENLQVTVTGPDAEDFDVNLDGVPQAFPSTIEPGASGFFSVFMAPKKEGPLTATLNIFSNDTDENPFTITLTGNGVNPTTTLLATSVTQTSANLNGTTDPYGVSTTAQFEYGLTTEYGETIAVTLSPNDGLGPQFVTTEIVGLQPGTTYHYRLVTTTAYEATSGGDRTFTTPTEAADFTYTISDDQVTITGYTGVGGDVVIPGIIEGFPVVSIGESAFFDNETITSVVIPEGVYAIGLNAFAYCDSITSVTIPNTVNFIEGQAFRGCSAITSIFIPESVSYISVFAFDFMSNLTGFTVDEDNPNYSSLEGVLFNKDQTTLLVFPGGQSAPYSVPTSVTRIEDYAFYFCSTLSAVTLPDGLQSIGYGAFEQCDSLTSVIIPSSVSSIGGGAFADCNGLNFITVEEPNANFTSQAGVLFNDDLTVLLQYPAGKVSANYLVPSTVTSIASQGFINADGLTGITLPAGLTSIGLSAFYECSNLASIVIPSGVTSLGHTTFAYCSSLASVILPEGLATVGPFAFIGCSNLVSIIIPSTVTSIGDDAFRYCYNLASAIFMGEAPSVIDAEAFGGANEGFYLGYFNAYSAGFSDPPWTNFNPVNLGVPAPGISVYEPSVTELVNGDSRDFGPVLAGTSPGPDKTFTVRNTGYAPLNISGFTLDGDNPADFSLNGFGFPIIAPGGTAELMVFFSPMGTGLRTATLTIESNVFEEEFFVIDLSGVGTSSVPFTYRIEEGEVHITGYTGPGGAVVVPATVEDLPVVGIDDEAFSHQSGITSITLPEGIRSIGQNAFFACDGLTGFTIPDSVTHIGSSAFSLCSSITQIEIPANVSTIGTDAFGFMGGLTQFTVDALNTNFSALDGVLFNIDQSTLLQYPGGLSGPYSVPLGVSRIERSAFASVTGLTGITFTDDLTSIGAYAFGNTGLTNITIPASVAVIGAGAFSNCPSLSSIDVAPLNGNFEGVGGVLFNEDQSTLIQYPAGKVETSYTVPASVVAISESAFFGAKLLSGVVMPPGLLTIGSFAFYDCRNLESVVIPAGVTQINIQTFAYCNALDSVTLPEGLLTLGPYAFQSCGSLVNITIPGSVTVIEYNAFLGCGRLETATFLGNAPVMGEGVFDGVEESFYAGYYDPYEAGFIAPTWPGYPVVNLGDEPAISSNAYLADLEISTGALSPGFAPNVTAYSVTVPSSTTHIALSPSAANAGAIIRVNGLVVASDTPSDAIPLETGSNPINVEVTAEDEVTKKTYSINVIRAASAVVTTNPAEFGAARTILLKGTVIPNGIATVYFEYGEADAFDNVTPAQVFQGSQSRNFTASLAGLSYGTTYQFRAVATGIFGTLYGVEESFTTLQEPPIAATGDPYAVGGSAATLVGAVDPRGIPTDVYFEYGLTNLYGKRTPSRTVTSAGGFQDFLSPSGGLIPYAIYHYRIVASNEAGTTYGADVTFRMAVGSGVTDPIPTTQPTATTGGFAGLTADSVILLGTVNPNRGTTVVQFQFGLTTSYGRSTSVQGVGNGTDPVEISLPVAGLLPGTTYQYRLLAGNSAGTTIGANQQFTTNAAPPSAVTGSTEVLSTTSVRINGSALASGAPADVFIDFGTDLFTFSGSMQAAPGTVSGANPLPVTAELENLGQGLTYFYRVRAVGPGGVTGVGETKSFQVALLSGLIQQFPDAVPLAARQGSLEVVIDPALATSGWRFLGEKPWRPSGTPATGLTTGDRVIEFRPVAGFIQPPNETVAIVSSGSMTSVARSYTPSGATGSGAVNVILRPEGITEDTRPFELLAQWAMFGEVDGLGEPIWRDSGTSKSGLLPGNHIIIAKAVTGRSTPLPVTVRINDGETTSATITYYVAGDEIGTPPEVVDFDTVSNSPDLPYAYAGQLRSDAGTGSGFVVRPGVVATAAHVMFDDGTLSSATNMQWLHRHDPQVHDPVPLIPRGYFMLTGYAAQRADDNSPGSSTPESQNLDAAAAYFLSDPGDGGFSGYLASDSASNEFLLSSALKTLVGYPVEGTAVANLNRMHQSPPSNVAFIQGFGKTYVTSDIRSSGGGSGGPLCVQYENGSYYPAAIYLGGTAQTVVRAIDSDVAGLIGFAEASAALSAGNTGGEVTQSDSVAIANPVEGELEVTIESAAARAAGAGWRIQAASPYLASGASLTDLTPNTYTMQFASVPGFVPPTPQAVEILAGFRKRITFTYEEIVLPPVIGSSATASGVRSQPFSYQIVASNSPTGFSLLGGLPVGLAFNGNTGLISGSPDEAGVFDVIIGVENSGGADSKPLVMTSLPALNNQAVVVPFNAVMSYAIVSSESGDGVVFGTGPLPPGLSLNPTTGVISGTPQEAGTFHVSIQVTRRGATAGADLQMDFTGSAPEITDESELNPSVPYGGETSLSVSATGSPAPGYQWYRGASGDISQAIIGANAPVFTTPPLNTETRYWVRVASISGFVDSSTFTVSVLQSGNANLSNLIPSAGSLAPSFNAGIPAYTLFVPNEVQAITFSPFAEVPQSTVTINGFPVPLESASATVDLVVGMNNVAIQVTAGNGIAGKSYNVAVTRGAAPILETGVAGDITDSSALLHGTATPNGTAVVFFEYGTDITYGDATPGQEISGNAEIGIDAPIFGLTPETIYHFRIGITTGAGTIFGDDMTFETSDAPPTVATGDASDVESTKVKLIGAVDSGGNSTTVYFQWGDTILYGNTTTPQAVPAGTNVTDIQFTAGGLIPGNTYFYRLVATNSFGTAYGENVTFVAGQASGGSGSPVQPPSATTGGAVDVTTGTVSLLGTADPNGGTTFVRFEYGLTNAYGSSTSSKGIGNGTDPAAVVTSLTGLLPGRIYHYRLVASNSLGSVNGSDATFTTLFPAPLAATGSASPLSATSARITGTVRPRGANADAYFEYGTDGTSFPNRIRALPGTVGGELEFAVKLDLANLQPQVTYYYRLAAERTGDPSSSTTGEVESFEVDALYGLIQKFTSEVPVTSRDSVLTVNLAPEGVGAWRFVGETDWRPSGVPVGGLTSGDRLIEYLPAPGYIQPPREQIGIVNGEDAQVLSRFYFQTTEAGSASLKVILGPDSISATVVPLESRAQWRLAGEIAWRNSNSEITGLPPGAYLVEFKSIPGRNTPPGAGAELVNGQTTIVTMAYPPASAPILNPPVVVPFATSSTTRSLPYAYVGQFRTDAGSQSGFVVKPRVVATTSLAIFNDTTLTRNTGMQWLLQRDKGTYEPTPQTPRGSYVFTGYDAQRELENTPGTLSTASQNLNVAALYFAEDAGRGGFSGYLSSDNQTNVFLQSAASKTMVGYPVNGVSEAFQGRMHATPLSVAAFGWELGRTYSSSVIRGLGGMDGGPLCVQYQNGSYLPAGIFVGGTSKSIVRAIDGDVIDMFNRAEISSNGGDNNTGGGITHSSFTSIGATTAAALKVNIEPSAAREALAGWRLSPETTYRLSGSQKTGLSGGNYTLELKTVAGFEPPTVQSVTVVAGQLMEVTFTYQEANLAPSIGNVGNKTIEEDDSIGPIAVSLFDADNAENSLTLTGSSSNTSLVPNSRITFGGSGANRTVTVVPAADRSGSATITLTVSDGALSDTETFVLTVTSVNDAPTLTNIPNQAITVNNSTAALPFTVADEESSPGSLTLTRASSNTTLLPLSGIDFGGSGSNRTVTVTPASNQLGTATITITVSDGSLVDTDTFTLTVTGNAQQTWRFENFGTTANTANSANTADPDGDGQSNNDEFAAGTDPNNAADVFKILTATKTASAFKVTAAGKAGRLYVLERQITLGGLWEPVTDIGPLNANSTVTLTDHAPPAGSSFYRLSVTGP